MVGTKKNRDVINAEVIGNNRGLVVGNKMFVQYTYCRALERVTCLS